MTSIEELESRVDRLESRASIRELVTNYAVACDEHDIPKLQNLFTLDAVFKSPSSFMQSAGREAIAAMFIEVLKTRGPGYHWTHDLIVNFGDDENSASGIVYSHAETTPNGVVSIAAMKYQDKYRRESGVWYFSEREIHFFYYVPMTEYIETLNRQERLYVGRDKRAADFPESSQGWKDFENNYK
jgi:ketosteroid isomerase-like protein